MRTSTLIKVPYPDVLYGKSREQFVSNLRRALEGRVEKAIIFGSFNQESFHSESDIDLILVTETKEEFHRRCLLFPQVYDLIPRLDLRVYTPSEFEKLWSETAGFWKSVKQSAFWVVGEELGAVSE